MSAKKHMGAVFVLLAATFWGTMGLFVRRLNAGGLSSLEVTQVRITIGLVVVGAYLLIFDRKQFRIRLKDLWCFLGTGIVSLLLFCLCSFKAMEYVSLSTAAVLLYTAPTFVMLMSLVLFKEKLTANKLIALVVAFAGCLLVSGSGLQQSGSLIGILLALGSGFFYALYSIFSRYAIMRGYSSWTIVFYTFLFCAGACAFLSDWKLIAAVVLPDRTQWLWSLGMGVITGFLPYLFYSKGLERMESSRASIMASLEPVVGTIVGAIFFQENPGLLGIVGIVLVLGAICILSIHPKSAKEVTA